MKKFGNYKLDKFRVYQKTYSRQINLIIHEKNVIGNMSLCHMLVTFERQKNDIVFPKYIFVKDLDFFRGTRTIIYSL